jgi:hypothetical protein
VNSPTSTLAGPKNKALKYNSDGSLMIYAQADSP